LNSAPFSASFQYKLVLLTLKTSAFIIPCSIFNIPPLLHAIPKAQVCDATKAETTINCRAKN